MLGSGRKEDRIPRNRRTVEQIITKLREAEVALSKGQPSRRPAAHWGLPNRRTTVGEMNMAGSRSIKPSDSKSWSVRTRD